MPHIAVCGKSKSGKSTRAASIARAAMKAARVVLYLTSPGREKEPFPCHWRTTDPHAMLAKAKKMVNCIIVLDECWTYLTYRGDHAAFLWFPNESRFLGHRCVFVSQNFKQVHAGVRNNIDHLYIYNSSRLAVACWVEDLDCEDLFAASKLRQHHCLYWTGWRDGKPAPVIELTPCKKAA